MTVVILKAAMGGDVAFRFVVRVSKPMGGEDCAPDRGFIQVLPPALGDANCDGEVDSRDAVIILQFFARLAPSLLCEYVADANDNGTIGSIDAALILQLDAGLISVLPGEARDAIAAVTREMMESGIPEEQIRLSSVSAETWPDGCLGLGRPGEVCTEALVPGYRIRLAVDNKGFTPGPDMWDVWRTDRTGTVWRSESISVR